MVSEELFEQCRKQQPKAQRALYELYRARLMGLCRRYTRNTEDARDILQEGFIKIFSKIDQLDSYLKIDAWMKSIVVRTAIDHYHKTKRIESKGYSEKEYEVADADYDLILDNLSDEYLLNAIHSLPEGCQLVFNLFEVEGYTHAEIAVLMKTSEATSRSQLHRAKYLLKQKLSQLGITRYEKLA